MSVSGDSSRKLRNNSALELRLYFPSYLKTLTTASAIHIDNAYFRSDEEYVLETSSPSNPKTHEGSRDEID